MGDTPTFRETVATMTDDQIDAALFNIRERRLSALKVYHAAEEKASGVREEKLKEKYKKILEQLGKQLDATTKSIEKLEVLVTKMRAMKLEIEE